MISKSLVAEFYQVDPSELLDPVSVMPDGILTVSDVLAAEQKLKENNVTPLPYELRAAAQSLQWIKAELRERATAPSATPPPDLRLNPGETWVGRISDTHIISIGDAA